MKDNGYVEIPNDPSVRIVTMTYVVTAYRWGWYNEHRYLVWASPDREKAIEMAREECEGRAGKYGVEVVAVPSDVESCGLTDFETVAYFPSCHDEKTPHGNPRIELFERVGQVASGIVEGHYLLTGAYAIEGKPEAPEWLRKVYDREKQIAEVLYPVVFQG